MFKRQFSNFFERVEHAGCPASPTLSTKSALEPEQAISRPLADAIELATKLMREHSLTGWRVKLDHARRRAGQCDYKGSLVFSKFTLVVSSAFVAPLIESNTTPEAAPPSRLLIINRSGVNPSACGLLAPVPK